MKQKTAIAPWRTGATVLLRPVLEDDLQILMNFRNNPDVAQFFSHERPYSMEDERAWFQKISKPGTNHHVLAIVKKQSQELIGTVGLHDINQINRTAITGTMIGHKKWWNHGYGTEAKMMILHFGFLQLNLRKIYSHVMSFNERSLRTQKRCGYVEEGRYREYWFKCGSYHDDVILSITLEQFLPVWNIFKRKLVRAHPYWKNP